MKTLTGGMHRLVTALVDYLKDRADLRFNTEATELGADGPAVLTATGEHIAADHIVLAINGPCAFDLMAPVAQLTDRPELGAGVALVALVVDDPRFDEHPRGTGMLVSPAATTVAAKAATHVTAKWDWARRAATAQADHRHVLRLSYGRITDPADGSAPGHDTADTQLFNLALTDAAVMFGLEPTQLSDAVVAQRVIRWRQAMPLTTPDNAQRLTALTHAAAATDWLDITGAWVAGTGLAAITKHATELYPLQ